MIVILGAGGHSRVIIDVIKSSFTLANDEIILLDDDILPNTTAGEYKVAGGLSKCLNYPAETIFFIAVGDNKIRKKISQMYHLKYATLIHSSAVIGSNVKIGEGSIVMPGAIINSGSYIGKHCIINTGATVDHDCIIHNFVHISPGAHLGGTVEIGSNCWIGIGCSIKNNLFIKDNCIVGAGAAVVKDITRSGVYVGVPAKSIK